MPTNPIARFAGRALLTCLAGLGAATTLAAAEPEVVVEQNVADTRAVEIEVADLDLGSAYDRDTLTIRIDNAAREVCDVSSGSRLDRLPDARACVEHAREQAFAQLANHGQQTPLALVAISTRH